MLRLCLQSEGKGQRNFTDIRPSVKSQLRRAMSPCGPSNPILDSDVHIQPSRLTVESARPEQCSQATATPQVVIPSMNPQKQKRLTSRTCLFCYGNPQRSHAQNFRTTASLRNHYRMVHFQYQMGAFPCPMISCNKIILDLIHFANHAVTVHKSDLGVRASIVKVQARSVKPGTLNPFRL
jgi:hypothetical protein